MPKPRLRFKWDGTITISLLLHLAVIVLGAAIALARIEGQMAIVMQQHALILQELDELRSQRQTTADSR